MDQRSSGNLTMRQASLMQDGICIVFNIQCYHILYSLSSSYLVELKCTTMALFAVSYSSCISSIPKSVALFHNRNLRIRPLSDSEIQDPACTEVKTELTMGTKIPWHC